MDLLTKYGLHDPTELDSNNVYHICNQLNKIFVKLSLSECDSIYYYLSGKCWNKCEQSIYERIFDANHQRLEIKMINYTINAILSTKFISQDVVNNILFEYICYKN